MSSSTCTRSDPCISGAEDVPAGLDLTRRQRGNNEDMGRAVKARKSTTGRLAAKLDGPQERRARGDIFGGLLPFLRKRDLDEFESGDHPPVRPEQLVST
jgi:hypothetical protein